jgi:hypothetical protein
MASQVTRAPKTKRPEPHSAPRAATGNRLAGLVLRRGRPLLELETRDGTEALASGFSGALTWENVGLQITNGVISGGASFVVGALAT